MNPVIISPEAEADLTEAYRWYEKQVEGLPALRSWFFRSLGEEG